MANELREYNVSFQPILKGENSIKPSSPGLRTKLGGKPDWEQSDETSLCPSCKDKMVFIAQIDSIEHDEDHNPHRVDCLSDEQQYMFGDVGLIYVFFCFDCLETKSVFQCG